MLTFRRADGREVSLVEFPLAQGLRTGETVRAEEIVLQSPGGRSVTTLVNATPIFLEEGEVESVVVTIQDMTPMEELERLRAEFLGMVSHELRTPLSSIKGSAATLTEAASDLDPAEMLQFYRIIGEQADYMRDLIGDLLDVARIETGELSVAPCLRMWRAWWTRPGAGSRVEGAGTTSASTSRRSCRWSWRTAGASSRC